MALLSAIAGKEEPRLPGHPRLYFTAEELSRLRALRSEGVHARIWTNLAESADWCLTQVPRTEWIAPVSPDPIYLNLYDRFYAMMHDMAVMEHLAFAHAYSGHDRYLKGARAWALSCCRVWKNEAEGDPDASKAYAVMRLLKGLAVSYDLLFDRLPPPERDEIRDTMLSVGRKYYQWYLQNPGMAGPDQDKHHGSVEASSFGVVALALLGEVPDAADWLTLMVEKHISYLLPQALTPSGTQEQSSNFWASTMQYRLFFLDALRRVTGRDLFKDWQRVMDARIALAAVTGPHRTGLADRNYSVIFGPSYGQLDYWSPVLLYLAREYRRSIYQHLALWDGSLGSIQHTGFITPNGQELLFQMGGYAYAWYDPTVPDDVEPNLPLSFEFPDVNEAYARASYQAGGIVLGVRQGSLVVHAGGRSVLSGSLNPAGSSPPIKTMTVADDGADTLIQCIAGEDRGAIVGTVELRRPDLCAILCKPAEDIRWLCDEEPAWDGDSLRWPDGTCVRVTKGHIVALDPKGHTVEKAVGFGKLKLLDLAPAVYPVIVTRPDGGELAIEVRTP